MTKCFDGARLRRRPRTGMDAQIGDRGALPCRRDLARPAIVPQTVGHVGVLLDLAEHDPAPMAWTVWAGVK